MLYLYSWIFSSPIYYYREPYPRTRHTPLCILYVYYPHMYAFGMSCKRSKPLLTSRFLLVSSYLVTRRTRSPYLLYVLYILWTMVGGVANYYATKNVDGLEVGWGSFVFKFECFPTPFVSESETKECAEN